ncbi:hypothetical protein COHA_006378 [Chlorella ohadii]|uniref:Uncharacterized protein n=1 Tax=Chlorella ohadii TaxID=2649997 RepID=A0AAD5H3W3_9CHLO|nr:hypothetical protein COHA_006378 [Chlorella ohadii]
MQSGLGYWLEKSTPNDGLQPAELDYSQIALAYEGVAWAQLAKVDGSGAASWPRLLPAAAKSQCGCCKLCFAQNVAALADTTGATPIKCKRWSYRSKDGVCRLFGPSSSTARSVALTAQTPKDQEWASGTAERYVNLFSPGQVAPGTAQCQFIALGGGGLSGGGGLPGGLPGGSSLRPPPPAAKAVDAAAPVAKSPPPPSKKPPPPRPPPPSPRPPSPKPAAKKPPPPPPLVARKALQPMG